MSDEKLKQVFSKNLKEQLAIHGKQPVDIVNDLGIPFSTVSNWINATKFPRMGKVELLAQYFKIEKSDLIEEKKQSDDYQITKDDMALLMAFHQSDYLDQQMVLRILGIGGKIETREKLDA